MRQPAMSILMANKAAKATASRTDDFIDLTNKEHRSLFLGKLSHVLHHNPDLISETSPYTHIIDCSIDIQALNVKGKAYDFSDQEIRSFNRQIALLLANRMDDEKYDIIVGERRILVFCDQYDVNAINTYLEYASEAMYEDVYRYLQKKHSHLELDDVTFEGHCEKLPNDVHLVPGMVSLQQAKSTLKMLKVERNKTKESNDLSGMEP